MTSVLPTVTAPTAPPLTTPDLLAGAGTLLAWLREALSGAQWLDAYLLAAGLSQLVEDALHPDPLLLCRAADHLVRLPSRRARAAGTVAGLAGAGLAGLSSPRLRPARAALTMLTGRLAGTVMAGQAPGGLEPLLAATRRALPGLAGEIVRLPACFRSFDQHPDDVRWLVEAFLRRYPAGRVPLAVVGVRTSGSHLAPLHAAALRGAGVADVEVYTYRPGRPFLRWERAAIRAAARVLVVDDPPGSGSSLASTASALERAGVPGAGIVLLVPVFGTGDELPDRLRRWSSVIQPWPEWSVHRRLEPARVQGTLAGLAGADVSVRPVPLPAQPGSRGHARARFEVRFAGAPGHRQVLVEGAGLGYLGRQSLAVAGALPDLVPHVYGFADGLLYRDWLRQGSGTVRAETVAGYVAARRQRLPAPGASLRRMRGRDPVWEVAAMLLSGQYGRLSLPARPLLLEPVVRRLLDTAERAVVDGKTGHRHWLGDGPRKVDFHQRAFSHLELASYDPVFDLAGAAADPPAPAFEAELRAAYRQATGVTPDGERWLLYRLAHLWRLGRAGDLPPAAARRHSAAAVHDYLAGCYLDLPAAGGPLCAIDLDGVLECDTLGAPATSPTGALALRALIAHGYRPVPATGRSVDEVRDRCQAFGLAGGVAEYGCALSLPTGPVDLRPPSARALLDEVRRELAAEPAVDLDPGYRYAVRASVAGGPLPGAVLARIAARPGLRVVAGQGQTDLTSAELDKATGLHALAARLGHPAVALAVGDSPADLPMLAAASLALAPRNAVRLDGVTRTRHGYQAGLADAVAVLIGHRPGRCPACRPPAFSLRTKVLLALLDLRSDGLASVAARTAALGPLIIRSRSW